MKEGDLQIQVCRYIQIQYPDVLFTSESSGVRLTIGQAKKLKAMRSKDCKLPDLMIFEPNRQYKGLFLELKREGEKVFKENGEPYAGHIAEQDRTLQRLREKGYFATFAVGFIQAQKIIDDYMI